MKSKLIKRMDFVNEGHGLTINVKARLHGRFFIFVANFDH